MSFTSDSSKKIGWIAASLCITVIMQQSAVAHGELHIRIATLTRKIQAATNDLAALYLQRGELYREDKSCKEAEADYERAANLDPRSTSADFCRGKLFADCGRFDDARKQFDSVLQRCPDQSEVFIERARAFVKLNQRGSAISDFRRGLELAKNFPPDCYLEFAQALILQQNTNEALQTLNIAIKNFGPLEMLEGLAIDLELSRKNYDAALSRIDAVAEIAPRKETWLSRRGDILVIAGRKAEAKKSFQAALLAIERLPQVIQKAAPMEKLRTHVRAQLSLMTPGAPNP